MLRSILFFLSRRKREREKWLKKWLLWRKMHPEFSFIGGCEKRGCKHYNFRGHHTCPWGALFVDETEKKLYNGGSEHSHCIEWIKDV